MADNTYVEESVEARKARLRQMEKDEREVREQQIEASIALTRNVNDKYFAKQEELAAQIAANKSKTLPKQTNEDAVAAKRAAYKYAPYNPNMRDPLLDREPKYVQDALGYHPEPLKPSTVARPETPKLDPLKRPQPEMANILANRPLIGTEALAAELQMRPESGYTGPMVECPTCHEQVPANRIWHMKGDVKCPVDIPLCIKEGFVISAPTPKKSAKK